jgi:hypothetical protein
VAPAPRSPSRGLQTNDFTSIGRAGQSVAFFERYIVDPTRFGNRNMPKYRRFDAEQLHDVAIFLAVSKGPR